MRAQTILAGFAIVALTAVSALPAGAATPNAEEQVLLELVNEARAEHGLPVLPVDERLAERARAHSASMAASGGIEHSTSMPLAGTAFPAVGENVGAYSSIGSVHLAFLASEGHRRNVLGDRWTAVGIGVLPNAGGSFYVTELFGGLTPTRDFPAPSRRDAGFDVASGMTADMLALLEEDAALG